MKILLLTNKSPFPPRDGGALATFNMIRGLLACGQQVFLLGLNTRKHAMSPGDEKTITHPALRYLFVDINTRINPFRALFSLVLGSTPYHYTRFLCRKLTLRLTELLRTEPFDLIQVEGLPMAVYLPAIRSTCRVPVALRAHNVEHEIWNKMGQTMHPGPLSWYLRLSQKKIRRFERRILEQVDLLVPISRSDQEKFAAMRVRCPVHLSQAGLFMNEYTPADTDNRTPDLFYIGALDWLPNRNGLGWFVQNVWPTLRQRLPSLMFHVAGRNAPSPFSQRIRKQGVIFEGEVTDALRFINSHSIMVVPVFAGSGLRIKVLEGMAVAKAIVSTTLGAEGIPCTHGTHLMIANNANEFIDSITMLLGNASLRRTLGQNARDMVRENFDNLVISASLVDFYTARI